VGGVMRETITACFVGLVITLGTLGISINIMLSSIQQELKRIADAAESTWSES
jgi:hypothetical protein